VVTALTAFALEQGIISGAVMAGGSPSSPEPFLAKNEAGVTSCAGSKYTAVPTLTSLNRAARDGMENLGVVGRPCQVTAVRKGQQIGRENPGSLTFAGSAGLLLVPESRLLRLSQGKVRGQRDTKSGHPN